MKEDEFDFGPNCQRFWPEDQRCAAWVERLEAPGFKWLTQAQRWQFEVCRLSDSEGVCCWFVPGKRRRYVLDDLLKGPLLHKPRAAEARPGLYAFFETDSGICAHVGISGNLKKNRLPKHYSASPGEMSRFRDMVGQHLLGLTRQQAQAREGARRARDLIKAKFGYRTLYTDSEGDARDLEDRAKEYVGGEGPSYGWPYLDDPKTRPTLGGSDRQTIFAESRERLGLA